MRLGRGSECTGWGSRRGRRRGRQDLSGDVQRQDPIWQLGALGAFVRKWMRRIFLEPLTRKLVFLELDFDLIFLEPLTRELSISMGRTACGRRGKRMTCAGGDCGVVVEKCFTWRIVD
jgi:hypothetical protein